MEPFDPSRACNNFCCRVTVPALQAQVRELQRALDVALDSSWDEWLDEQASHMEAAEERGYDPPDEDPAT